MDKKILEFLSAIGKKGGSVKSEKKAKASRKNGKRPKKNRKLQLFYKSQFKLSLYGTITHYPNRGFRSCFTRNW